MRLQRTTTNLEGQNTTSGITGNALACHICGRELKSHSWQKDMLQNKFVGINNECYFDICFHSDFAFNLTKF